VRQGSDPQVLIVGAGPVGLTMASELTRYGVAVRIVDKAAERTDKSKALALWSRTLELFDRAGLADTLVAAGQKVTAANILAGHELIGHVSLSSVESSYRFALMLPQSDTERLLETHLAGQGIAVERTTEAVAFTDGGTSVRTILRGPGGSEETVETPWLIACDGARSDVRHSLGLAFDGETLATDWILADLHIAGYPFPESEIAMYWHRDGILAVFPISPDRFRVIADVPRATTDHPADPTLEQVQAILARRGTLEMSCSDPIWLSAFRINDRKVRDFRLGRIFLAGDAAHVHSPAGGQGMNTGMQDAFNLAWKLALVCRGACAEGLLDSYSPERSAVATQVLEGTGRLTKIGTLGNHAAQTVRNLVAHALFGLAPVQHAVVESMSEISVGYKQSPLNGPGEFWILGPLPGQRVPPVPGQSPVGGGDAPHFALFAAAGDAISQLIAQYPGLIDPELRPPLNAGGVWLVRPDGYVACVTHDGDAAVLPRYLEAVRGGRDAH
jgi:2-polyprenyl-6-methoxyphenol hydroxylase-like FAD-dependent oxidoreductase